MLTIICGENTIQSRTYFVALQKQFKEKGDYIELILPKEIHEIAKDEGGSVTLFEQKKVYFIENLSRLLSRTKDKTLMSNISYITSHPTLQVIDWEEGKASRDIRIKEATIKEFKADKTIFQLLDLCYPGNKLAFIETLNKLLETEDAQFIFTMLCRHIRILLLARHDLYAPTTQSWQRAKISKQASLWPANKLFLFYESLFRLDYSQKTSTNVYSLKNSLELLTIYFL